MTLSVCLSAATSPGVRGFDSETLRLPIGSHLSRSERIDIKLAQKGEALLICEKRKYYA